MASAVIQMDYEVITQVSKGFKQAQETLNAVDKALSAAILLAKLKAMMGNFIAQALANYLENIQRKVRKLATVCGKFSKDLADAIKAHQGGDLRAGQYFQEGLDLA